MKTDNSLTIKHIGRIFEIFVKSEGEIRPHFVLTGPSGSGKTWNIKLIADQYKIPYYEINAAQLTKEGTSGNSLSKALAPLMNGHIGPKVVFVDEFDKLFISGNSNSSLAHETTNGVQNEFLKVLESDTASIYHEYGKYLEIPVDDVLFVFAGAFNGEENITIDRLRDFGIKTEFLGRVGLSFSLKRMTIEDLKEILRNSPLLKNYLSLVQNVKKEEVVGVISDALEENYENNTLGARMINTLLHQYFITGELKKEETKKIVFQHTLEMPKADTVDDL